MNANDRIQLKEFAKINTYPVHGDISTADCILAFSFGYIEENGVARPGISNSGLASFIDNNLPELPIIAQFEIADALVKHKPALRIEEHRETGKYLDSGEVAAQALEFMKAQCWVNVIIVTHSAMEARNDYVCTALGMKTIAPAGLENIDYEPLSAQEWTRDAEAWWKREEAVIDLCFENGWLKKPQF